MKISRSKIVNHHGRTGIWMPPKRWKRSLYALFGRTAPDRYVLLRD